MRGEGRLLALSECCDFGTGMINILLLVARSEGGMGRKCKCVERKQMKNISGSLRR